MRARLWVAWPLEVVGEEHVQLVHLPMEMGSRQATIVTVVEVAG